MTEKIDIWKHIEYAGDVTYKPKPQYNVGEHIFTCPLCGEKVKSSSFLNIGYFQAACKMHIEGHDGKARCMHCGSELMTEKERRDKVCSSCYTALTIGESDYVGMERSEII